MTKNLRKKGNGVVSIILILVVVLFIASVLAPMILKLMGYAGTFIPESDKCELTQKTLTDYTTPIKEYQTNKAEITSDAKKMIELKKACQDFKLCFTEKYQEYKDSCEEILKLLDGKTV